MNKPLAITAKQTAAIARGAVKGGCVAEIELGGVIIRLVPQALDKPSPQAANSALAQDGEEDFDAV